MLYAPISLVSGRARFSARLIDASAGGVRIETRTARMIGEVYSLEVRRPSGAAVFRVKIIWDYYLDERFISGGEMLFRNDAELQAWVRWVEEAPTVTGEEEVKTGYEQRVFARRPTNRPILFRDRNCWVKGYFRDISEGGSGAQFVVHCEHPPSPVARFRVQIDDETVTFRAQTVWTRMVNGAYLVGLRGIEPEAEAEAAEDAPPQRPSRSLVGRETTHDEEIPPFLVAPPSPEPLASAPPPAPASGLRSSMSGDEEPAPPGAPATSSWQAPVRPPSRPAGIDAAPRQQRASIPLELPPRGEGPATDPAN